MRISQGNFVSFHYIGSFEDGKVFDQSPKDNPLNVTIGSRQIIPGLEEELIGLSAGDKKRIVVPCEKAYGLRNEGAIITWKKEDLAINTQDLRNLVLGEKYSFRNDSGQEKQATLINITENELTLDFNHELAGKNLIFDVEILNVK